ncbi:flagellar basal body P-ring protein FlgI [Gluconobacter cerinus]|uniref:flagellar basal body P-ring protein FlgI n=1 Tax=Gluconobacter TaxID=441 RepID=UPI001B8AD11B|nr:MULTISPECIES: flagellar basal body P-ring protein FlgI [Gluconobacter]MBS1017386.1 flagellar basal body P-ring protein FlgI [Gluconobacter cerinus]MBS1039935.1 flagellar basal body P-ring protein FlgI [Gluconobacter cerinus]MBS1045890.1 flagellar basal body P-ring protein FlgI [Gluconobacter cerinus]MBS1071860.1 flagellar basal body P-ring protein FlgI [Gluconobacter cerinus]
MSVLFSSHPIFRRLTAIFCAFILCIPSLTLAATVRIKDITDMEGVRTNQLIGYGLVVGLNGTGDRLTNSIFTRETLISMLNRLGVNIRDQETQLQTHDVAAVMVTADLPAFAHGGNRIDVTVSAAGDSSSLTGGTLLVTPLMAADGEVYAVAQGSLATNAFSARGAAASVTRNVPTSGHIANGAVVEREVPFDLSHRKNLHLSLRNPDLTTASRMAAVINRTIGPIAVVEDPRTVLLDLSSRDPVPTLSRIGDLLVTPDNPAKVIVDEASGTIIMGADVRISTVAVAQGNLTVQITETPQVSQPGPFSNGQTAVVPRTNVKVDTGKNNHLAVLPGGTTLRELVSGLNALGVGPRDMISILQAIKADGALQAELEMR